MWNSCRVRASGRCLDGLMCRRWRHGGLVNLFKGSINMDFYDIPVVIGFNVPTELKGGSSGCNKVIQ